MPKDDAPRATLYRMVMPGHVCPHGLKAKDLLERQGYAVDDRPLTSRAAIDAFKAEHGVRTTPQTFIDGDRIGGHDDLKVHFGKKAADDDGTSYRPVVAIFATGAGLAMAFSWFAFGTPLTWQTLGWFVSINMVLLGLQKLQDLEGFSTMFLNYDLLARRWLPYGYVYPFAETGAGLLMTAMVLHWVSVPVAFVVSAIGAASVFKAVYVEKRELRCACVGGGSNVPLGFVSLTENLAMLAMSLWMAWRFLL